MHGAPGALTRGLPRHHQHNVCKGVGKGTGGDSREGGLPFSNSVNKKLCQKSSNSYLCSIF